MTRAREKQPDDTPRSALIQCARELREIADHALRELRPWPDLSRKPADQGTLKARIRLLERWLNHAATVYNAVVDVYTNRLPSMPHMAGRLPPLTDSLLHPRGKQMVPQPVDARPWDMLMATSDDAIAMRTGKLPVHVADADCSTDALMPAYQPTLDQWHRLVTGAEQCMAWKRARMAELAKWLRQTAESLEASVLPLFKVGQLLGNRFAVGVLTEAGTVTRHVNFTLMEWVWKLWRNAHVADSRNAKLKHRIEHELPELGPYIASIGGRRTSGRAHLPKAYALANEIRHRLSFEPEAERHLGGSAGRGR